MTTLRNLGLLFRRSFLEALRNRVWLFVGISGPLLYMALFTPLLQKLAGGPGFPTSKALDVFLPGLLAFLAFGSGAGPSFTTIEELQQGTVERFRVTPVSRVALLSGPILSSIAWLFIFVAILVAIAVPFGYDLHITGMLVTLVLLAMTLTVISAFGVSIALLTKDISSVAAVLNGLNLPVLLLSGVLLPLTLAPGWMSALAHINPLYYVVEANRVLARGDIFNGTVGLAFAVMILLTGVTLWWATRVYRKAVA